MFRYNVPRGRLGRVCDAKKCVRELQHTLSANEIEWNEQTTIAELLYGIGLDHRDSLEHGQGKFIADKSGHSCRR